MKEKNVWRSFCFGTDFSKGLIRTSERIALNSVTPIKKRRRANQEAIEAMRERAEFSEEDLLRDKKVNTG